MEAVAIQRRQISPALIQSLFGYASAGLGLMNELLVAGRFGANATTDVFRWAGLFPYYATLVGSVAAPLLFRSRLFPRDRAFYLLREAGGGAKPADWIRSLALASAVLCLGGMVIAAGGSNASTMILAGACLAMAQVVFCVAMVPSFFYGATWVFVSLTAGSNLIVLLGLLSASDLPTAITWSMLGAGALISLAALLPPWVSPVYRDPAPLRGAYRGEREGLMVLGPVALSNLASALSVLLYFRGLSLAGPGVLSIYSVAQKSALLLAVPGNAVLNRIFREDSLEGSISPARVLRSVLPFALVAPLVSLLSFTVLCAVFDFDPASKAGGMVAIGCSFCAAFSALSLATNMLALGRATARHTIGPSVMSVLISGVAAYGIAQFNAHAWIVGAPAAANAIASMVSLIWVSKRKGARLRYAFSLFAFCFCVAVLSSAILREFPGVSGANTVRDFLHERHIVSGKGLPL